MNRFIFIGVLLASISIGCSRSENTNEAKEKAILAAKELVAADSLSEMELQNLILQAKATQSEYTLMGDTIAAAEFNKAFAEYIKQHDDSLSRAMF